MMDLSGIGAALSVWLLPMVFAITIHEVAHGWVADRLGDDTARMMGRITLNPLRHVDPFGTLLLPGMLLLFGAPFLFGYAKPVPVAFHRLNNPRRDMVWVALAGPAVNIAMAIGAALLMHPLAGPTSTVSLWLWENLDNFFQINVLLAVFNMLPIPPLDGGQVLTGLLPVRLAIPYARLERYGILVVMGLVVIVPMIGRQLGRDLNPLADVLLPVVVAVHGAIRALTGWA